MSLIYPPVLQEPWLDKRSCHLEVCPSSSSCKDHRLLASVCCLPHSNLGSLNLLMRCLPSSISFGRWSFGVGEAAPIPPELQHLAPPLFALFWFKLFHSQPTLSSTDLTFRETDSASSSCVLNSVFGPTTDDSSLPLQFRKGSFRTQRVLAMPRENTFYVFLPRLEQNTD